MKRSIITLIICYLSMMAIAAGAHIDGTRTELSACHVEFQSDITINPDAIEIASDNDSKMIINRDHQVFIDGREIDMNGDETELVEQYAAQVRSTIPEIVSVAMAGVEIGLTAVTEVFYAFSEAGPPPSLLNTINQIEDEVSASMYQDGNVVSMKGGEISGLNTAMNELEPALEQAISESVGDIIVSVGQSLKNGEGSLAERITAFTDRMENFEKDIEAKMGAKAGKLEQRAEGLCEQVYALQATESQLHLAVPAMREFDLVKDS